MNRLVWILIFLAVLFIITYDPRSGNLHNLVQQQIFMEPQQKNSEFPYPQPTDNQVSPDGALR